MSVVICSKQKGNEEIVCEAVGCVCEMVEIDKRDNSST
jgi:hypothetical protein